MRLHTVEEFNVGKGRGVLLRSLEFHLTLNLLYFMICVCRTRGDYELRYGSFKETTVCD